MKKGFTLIETVVALSVILIISFAFFTIISFTRGSFQNNLAKSFGVLQVENVKNIFDATSFKNGFQEFENNLSFAFGTLSFVEQTSYCEFVICTSTYGGVLVDDDVKCRFRAEIAANTATLSANVELGQKTLFVLEDYQKAVLL